MKISHILAAVLAILFSATPITAMTNNEIVVSIKPLHSIVANITKGVATPVLILSAPASPHAYTLKPSNARAISKAKVIFWIGPQVETFLKKPIANLNRNALVISFPQSENGEEHEEGHKDAHAIDTDKNDHQGHHHEGDPHVWLDPVYVQTMAKKIAAALSKADPANSAIYQTNLQNTLTRLDTLDKILVSQFANTKPILVYHNAYSHLAERYGLKIAGVLTNNPELKPGAKRISQIRQIIKTSNVSCIFSEPEFDSSSIKSLFADTKIKTGTLDPLGSYIKAGPDHYFQMMQQLADNIKNCH